VQTDALEQFLQPRPVGQNRGNRLAAREAFRRALIDRQVRERTRASKEFVMGVEEEKLAAIPNGQKMRSDVAKFFNKMWSEMLLAYKARKDASKRDSVGVASGYRTAERDNVAWHRAFEKSCRKTLKQRLRTGDEFGPRALEIIFRFIDGRKAPPGFSGHTHGIAADLVTVEKGHRWDVNSDYSNQAGWQKTWLYHWLVDNAWKHRFYQLKTETWHWEYHEGTPPSQCWGGKVKTRPVRKDQNR
jgi:hypothetical protein